MGCQLKQPSCTYAGQGSVEKIREIAETRPVFSIPGLTFMGALSDAQGNVLHIVPGQGSLYYERPDHAVLTNFSPFKGDAEKHPWMGKPFIRASSTWQPCCISE